MVFFSVLEGFLLYKALVVVFDTGDNKKLPIYLFGYGVPLAIVMITLITAIIVEKDQDYTDYHHPLVCKLGDSYIYYALDAPVVAVLICNIFVLSKGIVITWKVSFQFIQSKVNTYLQNIT